MGGVQVTLAEPVGGLRCEAGGDCGRAPVRLLADGYTPGSEPDARFLRVPGLACVAFGPGGRIRVTHRHGGTGYDGQLPVLSCGVSDGWAEMIAWRGRFGVVMAKGLVLLDP